MTYSNVPIKEPGTETYTADLTEEELRKVDSGEWVFNIEDGQVTIVKK
jgi:hypothetical protein